MWGIAAVAIAAQQHPERLQISAHGYIGPLQHC